MTEDTKSNPVPFLHFPGGMLCPIEPDDAPLLYAGVNDPTQRHYFDRYQPEQMAREVEWVNGLNKRADSNQVFKLVVEGGAVIGTMGIHNIDWKNRTATTGAMMFDVNFWGKKFGRNAKMVLLDHAFNRLNLELIDSFVIEYNTRSVNYSLACGYVHEALLPGRHLIEGKRYGRHVLSVTRATFEPVWEKFRKEHQIESFAEMLERTMLPRKKE